MNKKYKVTIAITLFFAITLLLDGRDQFTYFHDSSYDNYFSASNLNVENWTSFIVGILAVFGTWYVTNRSANEQIKNQQKLRRNQVEENRENLLLEKLSDLKIYYFIKNVLEDGSKSNLDLVEYLFFPISNVDVNYMEWQREINILNEYFRFKGSELKVERPIRTYPFDKNDISKLIIVNNVDLMLLISFKRLRSINLDINELFKFIIDNQEVEKFDYITYDMKNKMSLVSRMYFDEEVDYLRLEYQEFTTQAQDQILKINKDYNEFKANVKRLIDLCNECSSWDEFEGYYNLVHNYLNKYNYLQEIYHEDNEKNLYMASIKDEKLSFLKTVIVDTKNDYLPSEANSQLMIDVKQYKQIIKELDLQKSRLPE